MSKVTVYRYEHPSNQKGPYTAGTDIGWRLSCAHTDQQSHPSPYEPGEPWEELGDDEDFPFIRKECFGFLFKEDLDTWFAGWHATILDAGFVVVQHEVDENCVRLGNSGQVSFRNDGEPLHQSWRQIQVHPDLR